MHTRDAPWPVQALPREARRGILARVRNAAKAHGIWLNVCACKNPDLVLGSCNIAGTWPKPSLRAVQPLLIEC